MAAILVAVALALSGRMAHHEVFDTTSYLDFPLWPLEAGLENIRTYGYPLFVQSILFATGSKAVVPWAQYAVHVACVLCWYFGARSWFPRASWAAVAAASLLVTNTLIRNVSTLAADSLASSLAIAAIGMLMAVVALPRGLVRWLLLTGLVFLAYQVRPAYLFLVPLCPVLGVGLLLLRRWLQPNGESAEQAPAPWRMGGYLAGAALAPLVVFGLFRWATVGDFGLVSLAGHNFCGVAGQFLDQSTVPCLPAEVQPVALEALRRREQVAREIPGFSGEVVTSYITIEHRFDTNALLVFPPAAKSLSGGDLAAADRLLVRLAMGIVRCRPGLYAMWLGKAWARGIYMIVSELVIHPLVLVLLPLLLLVHFVTLARRGTAGPTAAHDCPRDMALPLNILLLIAACFSAFKLLLVIPTTPPIARHMDAAGVFWLPWFCLVVVDRWQAMRGRD